MCTQTMLVLFKNIRFNYANAVDSIHVLYSCSRASRSFMVFFRPLEIGTALGFAVCVASIVFCVAIMYMPDESDTRAKKNTTSSSSACVH